MKQLLFCDHKLNIKSVVFTDATVNVYDCIAPQKTTIQIKLNYDVENSDIIVIRDFDTLKVEYIGVIDTITNTTLTEIAMFPFVNIFDNECILSVLDGDVFTWIKESIEKNFVNTGDELNDYPIIVRNMLNTDVEYKQIIDSKNLFDNLSNIFLNTGIYVQFSLSYDDLGLLENIYADVYNSNEQAVIKFRYDNPMIVNKEISIENSHADSYNKAIIIVDGNTEKPYNIYLRDDNALTSNPTDSARIKQVKPKIIEYDSTQDSLTTDEMAEAIVVLAQKELCGDSFDHSIEFTVVRNNSIDWKYFKRCDFVGKDRIYYTYVTRVEYLSDKHAKITLGAYRYTFTEKFKSLKKKVGVIQKTGLAGVSVSEKLGADVYWFSQDASGNLILNYPDDATPPDYQIDADGNLILTYDETKGTPIFVIDTKGDLVYTIE